MIKNMVVRYYKLTKLLKEKKIPLHKMQKDLNISFNEIEKIKTNRILLSDTYLLICRYLNCEIKDILDVVSSENDNEPYADLQLITKNSFETKLDI